MGMKMAKASEADLDMAMQISSALDALENRFFPAGMKRDDAELFDDDNPQHCEEALAHLLDLHKRASLMRVVWGCAVMLDPRNRLVDPAADTIEHHPDRQALAAEVESLESEVARLKADAASKQARIDALMLEHCPDEMTPEQMAEWAAHQAVSMAKKSWQRDDEATIDLLELAGILAPTQVVHSWTDEQCQQAEEWAAARHFRASDNAVRVPPVPAHVAAIAAEGKA